MVCTVTLIGLSSFVLSKRSVDRHRYEGMKVRERMRNSNEVTMANMQQLDTAKLQLVQELEIEMMSDMYNRMTSACHKKCIPPRYKDAELGKGESVCLDRCVAKYLDIHERVGKKLTQLSMQDEDFMKKMQAEQKS
uniref:Mitochondrial import inner membrane translocase subunit n=7 Tax=Timema TaxID=61471 RepID=A0A7R8VMJ3_TIMDO|nr:unnamed protein product [Timema douglasi]